MFDTSILKKVSDVLWEIPKSYRSDMRVPARVYKKESLLDEHSKDRSLEQLVNVTILQRILVYALAM